MYLSLQNVIRCSQMSNPVQGTGSGGDRCSFAVMAALIKQFGIGPLAFSGDSVEAIMYDLTRWLNGGSDISVPEGDWWDQYLATHTNGAVRLKPVKPIRDRMVQSIVNGHLMFVGLDNYARQLMVVGANPYQWREDPSHPQGHVELVGGIGFGVTGLAWADVYDPLLGVDEMPMRYSLDSMESAGWHLYEVLAPPLTVIGTF